MIKRLNLFIAVCAVTSAVHAQWTEKDSLNLQQLLQQEGEIELNKKAVEEINFGTFIGTPMQADDEPATRWDTNLPANKEIKQRKYLSLRPYNARTPFNYDPVRMIKFKVGPNTWKYGPYQQQGKQLSTNVNWRRTTYSNWAKSMFDKRLRKSVEQIEATGQRYNPIGERANNMAVGLWQPTPGATTIGNSNVYSHMSGFGIGGLDFNAITTREFWDKSIGRRRARTLEVLRQYGDSTTTNINTPLVK